MHFFIDGKQAVPDVRAAHGQHSDRHAFSVEKRTVQSLAFDPVSDGVTEIKGFPEPLFLFILFHDILFDLQGLLDDFFNIAIDISLLKEAEKILVKGHCHFEGFCQSCRHLAPGKRF